MSLQLTLPLWEDDLIRGSLSTVREEPLVPLQLLVLPGPSHLLSCRQPLGGKGTEMGRNEEVGFSTTELESSGVWSQGPGCPGAPAVSRCLSQRAANWGCR